jgi:thymidylate synthase ThyX
MISKNASSQRAIPLSKFLNKVPKYTPNKVGKYSKGMESHEYYEGEAYDDFVRMWNELEMLVVGRVQKINDHFKVRYGQGVAKEIINRPLSPFRLSKGVFTAVVDCKGWNNFFNLRCASDAQSDIADLANEMKRLLNDSEPTRRVWHLPYASEEGALEDRIIKSVACCAKVSYRSTRASTEASKRIYNHLIKSKHWSPFEHQAVDWNILTDRHIDTLLGVAKIELLGNFNPAKWVQLRKILDAQTRATHIPEAVWEHLDLGINIERLQQASSDDEDPEQRI